MDKNSVIKLTGKQLEARISRRSKMDQDLEENLASSDRKWHRWDPGKRYRYTAAQLSEMAELLSPEEERLLILAHARTGSIMRAANELAMPYALAERLLRMKSAAEDGGASTGSDISSMLDEIELLSIKELQQRVSSKAKREALSASDIGDILRAVRRHRAEMPQGTVDDGTTVMKVYTRLPPVEEPDDEPEPSPASGKLH